MPRPRIAMISRTEPNAEIIEQQLQAQDYDLETYVCSSPGEGTEAIKGTAMCAPNSPRVLPLSIAETANDGETAFCG